MNATTDFNRQQHIRYFAGCLRQLPSAYSTLDTNRLTLVHFCVHALDIMGVLEEQVNTVQVIEWIYSLQQQASGGFCGGPFVGNNNDCTTDESNDGNPYAHSHIAMTYTALATLTALGDDLRRVDKEKIIESLSKLQRPDGSFQAVLNMPSESDLRFLYCACAISYMLHDWRGVHKDLSVEYILKCISFDGGIALLPGQEGHGGSTFCGIASLVLMGRLDALSINQERQLKYWCVSRQVGGMQGRPNKLEDTCYSYWIGGTLSLLNSIELLDRQRLSEYVMSCQSQYGGFSKTVGAYPDVLHSFYSMAWLSLSRSCRENDESRNSNDDDNDRQQRQDGATLLKELNCTLGICQERAAVFQQGDILLP